MKSTFSGDDKAILHLDMDAFYAQVEKLDDPALHHEPVIVGGTGNRGVVATASYEARRHGVHSAMPMSEARRRCPQAHVLPPRFDRYQEVSAVVRDCMKQVSSRIEPLSLDEAYVDLQHRDQPAPDVGKTLKQLVREATGLTCSVGIGTGKTVAKLASEENKPNGFHVVQPGEEARFLAPKPIDDLPGIGDVTGDIFRDQEIETIGQFQQIDPVSLRRELGDQVVIYHKRARGIDPRPVTPDRDPKSISNETTFSDDRDDEEKLWEEYQRLSRKVWDRLDEKGKVARTVTVKYRYEDFETHTRSTTMNPPVRSAETLQQAAAQLVEENLFPVDQPVRLIGVGVSKLREAALQTTLFSN